MHDQALALEPKARRDLLTPFVGAGAGHVSSIPTARSPEAAVEHVAVHARTASCMQEPISEAWIPVFRIG